MAGTAHEITDLSDALVLATPPLADWLVIAPVVWCIAIGAALLVFRKSTRFQALAGIPALAVLVALDAGLLWHVASGGPVTMTMGRWLPPFGISFSADLLGAFLNLTSAVAALACGLYGAGDVDDNARRYGFYPFVFLMMAGVGGSFLTGDIFNLYVWFEVLLISSFGLLILGSERGQLDGAIKYAFLNLVATTLVLVATAYLYGIFGTLNMADITNKAPGLRDSAPLMTLVVLYLLAFGMKAAAFPVNFWLPASYHTPQVVTSALFAGILTKVGIYALARTLVMIFPAERAELGFVIAVVAGLTMILGVLGALAQTDLRRLLGYLVISGIGIMLAGIALASPSGLAGTIFYAAHSIVVLTGLYFAAGLAARVSGSFSLDALGGLYKTNPLFAALTFVLFLSVSGLPPFSGLWPKIVLVKASLDVGAWWLAGAILMSGFLTTIALGRVWNLAYWRASPVGSVADDDSTESLPGIPFLTGMVPLAVLTGLSVLFGLFPEPVLHLSQNAARQLIDPSAYIQSVFPDALSAGGGQ